MDKQLDMFNIINKRNEIPDKKIPKGIKLINNEIWCPYCSKPIILVFDKVLGVKKCPYCGISEKDYNIKLVNDKWI